MDDSSLIDLSTATTQRSTGEQHLQSGRDHERKGRMLDAASSFESAILAAESDGQKRVLAEALRRLAVVCHHRNEPSRARILCQRSYDEAMASGAVELGAEALNTMAGFEFEAGDMNSARLRFHSALELGRSSEELQGRILQNLGILANVEGDLDAARGNYVRSLQAFMHAGDERGCAIAYHNLGMINSDQEAWDEADRCFGQSLSRATALGDVRLQGLCLLNHSEVHRAKQRYQLARESAESALRIFDELGARLDKADAYKVLGSVYRDAGHHSVAESRFRTSIALAVETGSVLCEAEASRELALLYQQMGRNQDALLLLNTAHRLFNRLNARVDLVDVHGKVADLEGTFLRVVAEWGQSIESSDQYTHGHCSRVADYATLVARQMNLSEDQLTTIRLGAYLHDLGKVRVPHEVLNKPGKLTPEEFEIIKNHPVWGLELLAAVEFPWDIKPIIRWHHEKYDGSGYPDRLRGEEIPLSAQIICIVDVYDALTTNRSYRAAMTTAEALAQMEDSRHWWRPDVYHAFMESVGSNE